MFKKSDFENTYIDWSLSKYNPGVWMFIEDFLNELIFLCIFTWHSTPRKNFSIIYILHLIIHLFILFNTMVIYFHYWFWCSWPHRLSRRLPSPLDMFFHKIKQSITFLAQNYFKYIRYFSGFCLGISFNQLALMLLVDLGLNVLLATDV